MCAGRIVPQYAHRKTLLEFQAINLTEILFCRINDAMCLWRNLWRVKWFPPSPDGGSPCSHMHWNSIKPAQLRTAAIRAVCNQIIYQNYGTLKRKFRNSLFNSILLVILLVQMWLRLWLAIQDTMKLFILWAKVGGILTQFLNKRQDTVSETACSSGRILHLQLTAD